MDSNLKFDTLNLFREYQKNKSQEIRNQIVQLNIKLAKKAAFIWANSSDESYDDLLQVACLGLLKAVERFELERGHLFSSFAMPYIRGEIRHYLRDKTETLRIPRQWQELGLSATKLIQKYHQEKSGEPSDLEIAKDLGIPIHRWQEVKLALQNKTTISLDLLTEESDEETGLTIADSIVDPKYRSFQLALEDQVRLRQALAQLEESTREILEFVFLHELSQKETAKIMGMSAITISRHVKKGLKHLKNLLMMEIW